LADSFGHDWKTSDSSGFSVTAFCEAVSEAAFWPSDKTLGKSAACEFDGSGSNPLGSTILDITRIDYAQN